jgi:hypothetical protein
VEQICAKIIRTQTGGRRNRMLAYRMGQIRQELRARPGGERILAEFERLGPVPDASRSPHPSTGMS